MKTFIRKLRCAVFGYKNFKILEESIFKTLSELLMLILKVATEQKPYMTSIRLILPDIGLSEEILTIWVGSGIASNPMKRITELIEENTELKEALKKEDEEVIR